MYRETEGRFFPLAWTLEWNPMKHNHNTYEPQPCAEAFDVSSSHREDKCGRTHIVCHFGLGNCAKTRSQNVNHFLPRHNPSCGRRRKVCKRFCHGSVLAPCWASIVARPAAGKALDGVPGASPSTRDEGLRTVGVGCLEYWTTP